ncbi:MAG: allantoinase AllB [Deltaproteobacteria bacterium]|nr:allantoinase AllB [Deltaproteobacteria bacterium]MBW2149507.1 allantoinase AllB [Deltaproteobacteria bacterium]
MAIELVIKNGKIVTSQVEYEGDDIAIEKGKIVAIRKQGSFPEAKEVIDAEGKYILPGIIDVHVHFREPGFTYKEDFETGSMGAAAGGVTTVFDMPNNKPYIATVEALEQKLESIQHKAYVDFGLIAAVTANSIHEIPALAKAGINAFKIFMADVGRTEFATPEAPPDDGGIWKAFQLVAETGLRIGVHAENNSIVDYISAELKKAGRTDPLAHVEGRPSVAEAEAIARAILFAAEAGCKLHIYHMSSKEGVQLVKAAKAKGLPISAEVGPLYLHLTCSYMNKVGSILKMNPPVRYWEDGEALWQGLADGTIDIIATDHSPHAQDEKIQENIWEAKAGLGGVETCVPLMLTQVNAGRLSLSDYVKRASEYPSRLFHLYPRKGTIQVGSDADFTIVEMEKEGVISSNKLHSKSKVTPFDGWKVKGMPVYTIVRGKVVMKDGKVTDKPQGEFIKPVI